ncbi:hypothetical protein AAE478_001114 [Parahypoxylon ruwenzoriense]
MSTAISTRTNGLAAESGPKHRACDECRTRKLACTKEPDGCSRCGREGIACRYSLQKPMGRPRKRRRDESSNDNNNNENAVETAIEASANKNTMTEIPPDTTESGLSFLNLFAEGDASHNQQDGQQDGQQEKVYSWAWAFGYAGDSLGDLGFDAPPQHTPSFSSSNIDPSLFVTVEPPSVDQVPHLSPNSAGTPESADSVLPPPPQPPPACAHTAALYLALESMQSPPNGVEEGILHARKATKTAYHAVFCPVCSFKIEPPSSASSADIMRNFQNLMLLAALVPSIVHAYQRILLAVDEETKRAVAERRRLIFKLDDFGGILWGNPEHARSRDCGVDGFFSHREMEPAMWRLTVRALLKADVYGLSGMDSVMAEKSPLHIGLKDIVLQMDQRSKARHAVVDPLVESGVWQEPACGLKMHAKGETPTCQKIIAIAKASIDSLIIA